MQLVTIPSWCHWYRSQYVRCPARFASLTRAGRIHLGVLHMLLDAGPVDVDVEDLKHGCVQGTCHCDLAPIQRDSSLRDTGCTTDSQGAPGGSEGRSEWQSLICWTAASTLAPPLMAAQAIVGLQPSSLPVLHTSASHPSQTRARATSAPTWHAPIVTATIRTFMYN